MSNRGDDLKPINDHVTGLTIHFAELGTMIMASGHSNYIHGEMDVDAHKGTFDGFMKWTVYGGAFIALTVILPTLVFAAGVSWFPALIATTVLGFIFGFVLKLKGSWYATLIGLAIIIAFFCAVLSIFF